MTSPITVPGAAPQRSLPTPEPMPDNIGSIQPGGGTVQALELLWGEWRRGFLKRFRPGYVQRMQSLLVGDPSSSPVEVIDSRDLKFFKNVAQCHFRPEDDPFSYRDRLPLARAGFAELLLFGGLTLVLTIVLGTGVAGSRWWATIPAALFAFVVYFFRDPHRQVPNDLGSVVSPADGLVVDIGPVPDDPYLGEPAIKIGIFLSVFNVHVNRCSMTGQLIRLAYHPGKFLNALYARSVEENERMDLYFAEPEAPHRRFIVKQIAGAIARRIVCEIAPGQVLRTGERFGMIKFGSRTELLLPAAGLEVCVKVGQKVQGGASLIARYATNSAESRPGA